MQKLEIVYIAGPITSSDQPANNRAAFAGAEEMLELAYHVINPWRNYGGDSDNARYASQPTYMRLSFHQLLCCDKIYMLPGWKRSVNCKTELAAAKCLELEVIYAEDAER